MSQKTSSKRKEHRHAKTNVPKPSPISVKNTPDQKEKVASEPMEKKQNPNTQIAPSQPDVQNSTPAPKRSGSFFNILIFFFHLLVLAAIGGLAFFIFQQSQQMDERISQEVKTLASSIQSINSGADQKQIATLLAEIQKINETVQNGQTNLTKELSNGNAIIASRLEQFTKEAVKIKDGQDAFSNYIKSDIIPQFSKSLADINKQLIDAIDAFSVTLKGIEESITTGNGKIDSAIKTMSAQVSADEFKETKTSLESNLTSLKEDTSAKLTELSTMLTKAQTLQTNLEANTIQIQKELQNLKAIVEIQSATK